MSCPQTLFCFLCFLQVTADLLDLLSSNSDVDHPLCEECTDQLLELLDQQLHLTEDECNDYSKFLDRLKAEEDSPQSLESLEKELSEVSFICCPNLWHYCKFDFTKLHFALGLLCLTSLLSSSMLLVLVVYLH